MKSLGWGRASRVDACPLVHDATVTRNHETVLRPVTRFGESAEYGAAAGTSLQCDRAWVTMSPHHCRFALIGAAKNGEGGRRRRASWKEVDIRVIDGFTGRRTSNVNPKPR